MIADSLKRGIGRLMRQIYPSVDFRTGAGRTNAAASADGDPPQRRRADSALALKDNGENEFQRPIGPQAPRVTPAAGAEDRVGRACNFCLNRCTASIRTRATRWYRSG